MHEPAQPMGRLFRYLNTYYGPLSYAIGSSIVHKILDLMPPLMVGWAIDTAMGNTPAWIVELTGMNSLLANITFLCAVLGIAFLLESVTEWMLKSGFLRLAQKVQHDLRLDAYHHLQEREVAYFEKNRTGNLMSMLNDDINQLERFLNNSLNQITQIVTLLIFASIALFSISWQLALAGLLPMPFIIWGSFFYQKIIAPRYRKVREAVGELSSRLENNISGILVIKSFVAELFEYHRVRQVSKSYRQANFEAIRFSTLYPPLIRVFIAIGMVSGLYFGARQVIEGNGQVTVGDLTLFAMLVQRLLWPLTLLGTIFDEFERGKASARRIFGLMDSAKEVPETENPVVLETVEGDLAFRDVTFSYQPTVSVIQHLDFEVKAGHTLGIAGSTGSGKTTLIKLLLRFYDVDTGAITVDGHDIREVSLKSLRQKIALVSQDVYLFHGTILENIAYGLSEYTEEEIHTAAKKAQLHHFIENLPLGYQSIVGERGIKLSGGQRQRISIARAILKDSPILVLDEATSSVDTETERAIQENLNQLAQGRTALIIAHRLSTIRHADNIIVIKDGKICESGTHRQLLQKQGVYLDLWKVQTGEAIGLE